MKIHLAPIPLALALALTGCGGGDEGDQTAAEPPQIPDGTFSGEFERVPTAPRGTRNITGTAEMVLSAAGTQVTLTARNLDPKATYVAHVHADACSAADPGGPHFQYTPGGGELPPNELHIPVSVNNNGRGTGQTTNAVKAGPEARSVVIHLQRAAGDDEDKSPEPKLACADLLPA